MTAKLNKYVQAFKEIYAAAKKQNNKSTYYYYNIGKTRFAFANLGDLTEALVQALISDKGASIDAKTAILYYAQHVDWKSGIFEGDVSVTSNESLLVKGNDAHSLGMAQVYGLALVSMQSATEAKFKENLLKMIDADPARKHVAETFAKSGNKLFEKLMAETFPEGVS